jgi:hypothetical protein
LKKQTNEKLTDKAFLRLIITSAIGILICLVCLCSTTWAWFSSDVTFEDNQIKTAEQCLLTVSVKDTSTELTDIENGVELQEGVTYEVTLTLPKDSASGYCLMVVGENKYYSDYIVRHDEDTPKTVNFTLPVGQTQTVKFITRWGVYAGESNVQNGTLHIG